MKLLVNEQKYLNPEHKRNMDAKQRHFLKIFTDILSNLKTKGEMAALDTTVCAFAFFGMVHWIHRWDDPKKKIKPEQLSEIFNRIFARGIYMDHC